MPTLPALTPVDRVAPRARRGLRGVCLAGVLLCAVGGGPGSSGLDAASPRTAASPAAEVRQAITEVVDLRTRIESRLSEPRFQGTRWGIQVWSLDTDTAVLDHRAQDLLIPASNTKLFTAALALDRLGPDFRIRTSVMAAELPDAAGRIRSGLALVGRGDPTLAPAGGGSPRRAALQELASKLTARGVKSLSGELIADERHFSGASFGSGWMIEDLDAYYSPEISALSYNDNCVDWVVAPAAAARQPATLSFVLPDSGLTLKNQILTATPSDRLRVDAHRSLGRNEGIAWGEIALGSAPLTNTLTVHDPASWCGRAFVAEVRRQGISWNPTEVRTLSHWGRGTSRGADYWGWRELAAIDSPPLSELLRLMMKPSNNLHAQLLFLQVGAREAALSSGATTEEKAADSMRRFLRGILKTDRLPYLEEGSGLSRRNGASASQFVDLFRWMNRHPAAVVFRDSLPIAGVDGTLRARMRGTAAEKNIRAKTGTLRGVNSLSGYLKTAGGESWAFSILLNDYVAAPGQRPGRDEVEAIAVMLAEFAGKTGTR